MGKASLFFEKIEEGIKRFFGKVGLLFKNAGKHIIIALKKIVGFLLFIWSYLPIMCLSHDSSFCEIRGGIKGKRNLRFSFINLFLGSFFLCVFTFPINSTTKEKFKIIKLLRINPVIIENEKESYEKDNNVLPTNIEEQKEAAYYQLERIQSRISVTQNKINSFLSIGLVIFPVLIAFLYKLFFVDRTQLDCRHKVLLIIGCATCLYAIICIVFLLLKNLGKEEHKSAVINFDEEITALDLVEIIRDDSDYENIRSLILTTTLLQIQKSICILFISFIILAICFF